jgi:hypothetical protein
LGNLRGGGGGPFTGTFERQMEGSVNGAALIKLIWAPFLDPDYVMSLSLGAILTYVKNQGSQYLASEYGA